MCCLTGTVDETGEVTTTEECRSAAGCVDAYRRTCFRHADCLSGESCCVSGAALQVELIARDHGPGDQQCRPSCEEYEAPLECAVASDCPAGQVCCRLTELTETFPPMRALVGTTCTDECPSNEFVLCRDDADCGAEEQCAGTLLPPGMKICGPVAEN